MKIDEIIDKLESYILLQSLVEDTNIKKWRIHTGETIHENGLKINNYIRLIEKVKSTSFPWSNIYHKTTYLEILYTDKFVTLNFFLKPQQKKAYNILRKYFLENKDVVKNADPDRFTVRFEDHDRFDEFFEKYIVGEDVCNLI